MFESSVKEKKQVARSLGPDACVVMLMVDSGMKYLSTDVFKR